MSLIKTNYAFLTQEEKLAVYNFVKENYKQEIKIKEFEALDVYFMSPIFNKGETLFCFWQEEKVLATMGVIVKDISYKGEIFITAINLDEANLTYFSKSYCLIEEELKKLKPKIIRLGISHYKSNLIPYISKLGFINPYCLYEMSYIPIESKTITSDFSIESLKEENKELFQTLNNSAFITCPNGGLISSEDVTDFIANYKEKPDLIGLFKYKNIAIGTFELTINCNIGIIDSIGVSSEHQGKGYGKILLDAVINKLQIAGATKIKLNVISTNTKAYNMYLNYGFTKDSIVSDWFEKKIEY